MKIPSKCFAVGPSCQRQCVDGSDPSPKGSSKDFQRLHPPLPKAFVLAGELQCVKHIPLRVESHAGETAAFGITSMTPFDSRESIYLTKNLSNSSRHMQTWRIFPQTAYQRLSRSKLLSGEALNLIPTWRMACSSCFFNRGARSIETRSNCCATPM